MSPAAGGMAEDPFSTFVLSYAVCHLVHDDACSERNSHLLSWMDNVISSKGPEVHFARAKDQACFTRNMHVEERRHLFVKLTL